MRTPVVIGHRGAAGHRPEHTLAGYELAARMGADYLEPDLVATRDGELVARHEHEISGTTDVARHPGFAARRSTKTVDGRQVSGWFTEEFTLDELHELRAVERLPELRPGNADFDRRHPVPTFAEIIELRTRLSAELGRQIGLYPETKHPAHFRSIGLALEPRLVDALTAAGLNRADAPVFVQSFDPASLRALREPLAVPLIQLLAEPPTAPLDEIAGYAEGIGPAKKLIVPRDGAARSRRPTDLAARAHDAGLLVHPYTFRNENCFLPAELRRGDDDRDWGDAQTEYRMFFELGADGVFSDFPDTAAAARAAWGSVQ